MTIPEILSAVEAETGISFNSLKKGARGKGFNAKSIAIMLMHEEGFDDDAIAEVFQASRAVVYASRTKVNNLLGAEKWMPHYDKAFKLLYLTCAKRIEESFESNVISIKVISWAEILERIKTVSDYSLLALKMPDRTDDIVEIRSLAMFFIKKYNPKMALKDIGEIFNRDHSSVTYAINRVEKKLDTNRAFKHKFQILHQAINQNERVSA